MSDTLISIEFNGKRLDCIKGESVASALLAAHHYQFEPHPADISPRGPFCMMGACQACLVMIDGHLQLACQTSVKAGLSVTLSVQR